MLFTLNFNAMHTTTNQPVYVPVYFKAIGKEREITLRYFDRLLHAFMLRCENGKWIAD
jgi:hypothetical protein